MAAAREAGASRKGAIRDEKARGPFDALMGAVPAMPGVAFAAAEVAGVAGWWCRPQGAVPERRLLFLHGGGYLLGTAAAFRGFASHFAAAVRADTFIPDYRRGPEHRFPAAVDDVFAVYRAMAGQSGRIALAGDSAGGGLALALLSLAAAEGPVRAPCCAAVMSPWTDLAMTGDTLVSRAAADPIFTAEGVGNLARLYLGDADPRDPRASPLYAELRGADLRGLPPVRIDVGDDEILLSDSLRYAQRLHDSGGQVSVHVWMGMPHVVPSKLATLAAARESAAGIGRFLDEHFQT